MALTDEERILVEAFDSMLDSTNALGLKQHEQTHKEQNRREHGVEHLHGQIDELFHVKAAELQHHTGVCAAFARVHSHKYIDDPTFQPAMNKEMTAQGIPAEERQKALGFVPSIIEELKADEGVRSEQDGGWLDVREIEDASFPDQAEED